MTELLVVERDGDLLWARLDDPRRANALSPPLVSALTELYERDWRAEGVRALLLEASGPHFSAGADLDNLRRVADSGLEENRADSRRLRRRFESILRQPALTLALVQGACVAGGCGLATACDFVVAAEDARFMYSEARIGFVAALVATYLPLRLRGSDIRELLLSPEFVPAPRALEIGLVNRLAPPDGLRAAGRALADEILSRASSESIARTKRILIDMLGRPLDERLDRAAEENAQSRLTEDCRRGVAAFLADKRTPDWRDR
jgi:methylglutaconyl-CoA hydratase